VTAVDASSTLTPPVSDSDHARGPDSAKVTLVEYGDYECSYCGRAYPIVKQLQRELGKQLRFVFRNFPLSQSHPHALHAAIAAEAVGMKSEDAFWQMHDALYEHQDALEDEDLASYAEALGVPASEVVAAFAGGPEAKRVRTDFRGGVRSGVNGTPTFFVNGERYDGNWTDVESFVSVLRGATKSNRSRTS
jgi:protein-disulfide isomerase